MPWTSKSSPASNKDIREKQPLQPTPGAENDDADQVDAGAGIVGDVLTDISNGVDKALDLKACGNASDKSEKAHTIKRWRSGYEVPMPSSIDSQVIHDEPQMLYFSNFVSQEEVDHLLEMCANRWERSLVTRGQASVLHGSNGGSTDGSRSLEGESRTSYSVHLAWEESFVTERIAARVASVAGMPISHVEPLVMLRYQPGEYFKKHHDGSFRTSTVFVYLNDLEDENCGGETYFPHLGLKIRPAARTAVLWPNRVPDGSADLRMQHEGKPVTRGVKYAINCFVGQSPCRTTSHLRVVRKEE